MSETDQNLSAVALDLMAAAAEIYMHCRSGNLAGGETAAVLRAMLQEMEDVRDDGRADYEKLHARRAARCNHRCGAQ